MPSFLRILAGSLAGGLVLRSLFRRNLPVAGQVVLITGGSRGLGLALAQRYARSGARINICARNLEELEKARTQLQVMSPYPVEIYQCDVSVQEQVDELVKQVIRRCGRLDVLINNASVIEVSPVSRLNLIDFKKVMDINFWGTVYTTWAALPYLKKSPFARVVNIASLGGEVSIPRMLTYCCSKFATLGFSEGLATELRHRNIPVLTVAPSLMRTGSYLQAFFKGVSPAEIYGFAFIGNQPGLSVDAERAAEKIFQASNNGKLYLAIGYQAKMLRVARALSPSFMIRSMGVLNTVIERTTRKRVSEEAPKRGAAFPEHLPSQAAIPFGVRAAKNLNQGVR